MELYCSVHAFLLLRTVQNCWFINRTSTLQESIHRMPPLDYWKSVHYLWMSLKKIKSADNSWDPKSSGGCAGPAVYNTIFVWIAGNPIRSQHCFWHLSTVVVTYVARWGAALMSKAYGGHGSNSLDCGHVILKNQQKEKAKPVGKPKLPSVQKS